MLYGEDAINPIEKLKRDAALELIKRQSEIQAKIKKYIESLTQTGWIFESSAGADLSISTPVAKLGGVGSIGALYLKNSRDSKQHTFRFAGLGGTVGGQLVPLPFNFDMSLPDFYSKGLVFKTPFQNGDLTENDFRGSCLMIQGSYQVGPGWSGTLMLVGGDASALLPLPGRLFVDQLLHVVTTSRAFIPFHGMNANLLPFGGGLAAVICGMI